MIAAFALLALALLLSWLLFMAVTRGGGEDARAWATAEGVDLDDTTRPVVAAYLRTSRNLRQIGAIGGYLIAPAFTAATGIDLELPGLLWLLTGYVLGCLWAELALTRRSGAKHRTASLTTRRLADYLPPTLLRSEQIAPLIAVALGLISAWLIDPSTSEPHPTLAVAGSAEVLQRGAILAAVLAPLAMAGVLAAQRTVVRRPQPLQVPAHLAVDDAMRSTSVRRLGATGLAIAGLLLSVQCGALAFATSEPIAALAAPLTLLLFLVALLQWRWWPSWGWRVRHRRPAVRTASLVVADGATRGDDHA